MKWMFVLMAMFTAVLSAADVTGTWKGTIETPNGSFERTFVFQVNGATLTGETSSQFTGKSAITDGKVEGDNISFTITVKFQDNDVKLNYKGKVSGDEIQFNVEAPNGGPAIQYTVRKVS
ncbi:MAG: hypothetical protein IRZ15_03910 [Bryobacteraceae bacterium]|nr:hypothetical protein [Bryobacteraceae bacterium]